jgi:hypothetical protein
MEISTAYPFLLAAYGARYDGKITDLQLKDLLQVVENYVIRRYICDEKTNYLNKMFPTLWKELDTSQFESSLREKLATKTYPNDSKVLQSIHKKKLYIGGKKTVLILATIEQSLWQGTDVMVMLDGKASLEHILPQNISTMLEWQAELGENWQQIQQDYLHTLGNLTLVTTNWNSEMSNRAFADKRGLLVKHGFKLNTEYFAKIAHWNESAIQKRADYLAAKVLLIWPSFGTAPIVQSPNYTIPEMLYIGDQIFEVKTWRDVVEKTIEYFIKRGRFDIIRAAAPRYFEKDSPNKQWSSAARLLSNGWRVHVSMAAGHSSDFCLRLVRASGLSESLWKVTTK